MNQENLEYTSNYVDGLQQGEEKWYYKTGALKNILNYVDGVPAINHRRIRFQLIQQLLILVNRFKHTLKKFREEPRRLSNRS